MGNNTYTFDGGQLSAVSNIRVTSKYECACGASFTVQLDWPEGLTQRGAITIRDLYCPTCSAPVVLPNGRHWVEGFELRFEAQN